MKNEKRIWLEGIGSSDTVLGDGSSVLFNPEGVWDSMTRNMVIKWLKWIQNMFDPMSEQYKALQFAIDSLEVDEAYQLEYERFKENKNVKDTN